MTSGGRGRRGWLPARAASRGGMRVSASYALGVHFIVACAFLVGCAHAASNPSPACPTIEPLAVGVPGIPEARRVPGAGMATTINPGMNSSRDVYEVDASYAEVVALYRRCLGEPQGSRFAIPGGSAEFPSARRFVEIEDTHPVRITVGCDGCY
jgi:hypothetical protein